MGIRKFSASLRYGFVAMMLLTSVGFARPAQAQTVKRVAVLMFNPRNYGTQWITPDTGDAYAWRVLAHAVPGEGLHPGRRLRPVVLGGRRGRGSRGAGQDALSLRRPVSGR